MHKVSKLLAMTVIAWGALFAAQAWAAPDVLVKMKGSDAVIGMRVEDEDIQDVLDTIESLPAVEWAEPNQHVQLAATPNDSEYFRQWYPSSIQLPAAWDVTTGSSSVTVALIDGGVWTDHPDLRNNVWTNAQEVQGNGIDDDSNGFVDDVRGWDFITNTNDPLPKGGSGANTIAMQHGTVAAGLMAAVGNNGQGIAGAAWNIRVMPLRVLNHQGNGTTYDVGRAIYYAINKGVKIINLSLVGSSESSYVKTAILEAKARGILVIAAAGNGGSDEVGDNLSVTPQYPVCTSGDANAVLGVAAVNQQSERVSFSNYGACVDLAAPGVSLYATTFYSPTNGLNTYYDGGWSGTSFATPIVSGVAALLWSQYPNASLSDIVAALKGSALDLSSKHTALPVGAMGSGLVQASAALNYMASRGITQTTTTNESVVAPPAPTEAQSLSLPQDSYQRFQVVTIPEQGAAPHVRRFDPLTGKSLGPSNIFAFHPAFRGGATVAGCNLYSSGEPTIVVSPGIGGPPVVRIFGRDGVLRKEFEAYAMSYRGGIRVACGDLNNDGVDEIVTTTISGGPQVRVFTKDGKVIFTPGFFAYDSKYRGGVEVAVADVTGDGEAEIITAPRAGGANVRIFNRYGVSQRSFFAWPTPVPGGLSIAAGNVTGDVTAEIVVGTAVRGGEVRVFSATGQQISSFRPYTKSYGGGVFVAVGDVNGDGRGEIITAAGKGGGPQVRFFDSTGKSVISSGFFTYATGLRSGVRVGVIKE